MNLELRDIARGSYGLYDGVTVVSTFDLKRSHTRAPADGRFTLQFLPSKLLSRSVDFAQSSMTVLFTLMCIIVGFGVNACGNKCPSLNQ